jgi:hypothetical protein
MRLGGLAAAMPAAVAVKASAAEASASGAAVREPARDIPVAESADVVVCGGGPAGVAAALGAARKGAKTLLLEQHGCLGGIWTSGLLAWLLDCDNKTSLMAEIVRRMDERGARTVTAGGKPTNAYDVEVMKAVLEALCAEAGVEVRYHVRSAAAVTSGGRLTHVITESKSGREAVAGQAFVDATGDGDLGAQAGCGFDFGQPGSGLTQPMSLICLVAGVRAAELKAFYNDLDSAQSWAAPKDALRAAMEAGGHSPSYAKPSLFRVRDDLFILMANHEYGFKGTSARDVSKATLRARKELNALLDGLRGTGGVWKNLRLVATAEQIGVREGRRLRGLYTVTADDLKEGRRFDGSIPASCRLHVLPPSQGKPVGVGMEGQHRMRPYDIPLRAPSQRGRARPAFRRAVPRRQVHPRLPRRLPAVTPRRPCPCSWRRRPAWRRRGRWRARPPSARGTPPPSGRPPPAAGPARRSSRRGRPRGRRARPRPAAARGI